MYGSVNTNCWRSTIFVLLIGIGMAFSASLGHAVNEPPSQDQAPEPSQTSEKPAPKGKWLPVPMFLTEPAFGYGLGVGIGYFHPEDEKASEERRLLTPQTPQSLASERSAQKPPPDITGVAGGYTHKDTWFGAVGHSASWRDDTIRYVGAVAYADLKSTYYILDLPLDFSLEGFAVYQGIKFRLGGSPFFLGGKLTYLDTKSRFDLTINEETEISLDNITSRDVGAAMEISFDRRDNNFTPNCGQLVNLSVWRHDEAIGGDFNYWHYTFKALSFHQLASDVVLGLRLEGAAVDGLAPFYAYPWVKLRGIPAMRYQAKEVGVIEVEARWNILSRWALVGFAGKGVVLGKDPAFETQDDILAGGIGGRYLYMPDQGLWLGVDLARGPEDWYVYVTVGHAW